MNNCSSCAKPQVPSSLFALERLFVRGGYSWQDLEPVPGLPDQYHHSDLLLYPLLAAALIYAAREFLLVPRVFRPLARLNGLRWRAVKPPAAEPTLQRLYGVNRARPPKALLEAAAADVGWPPRKVERWLRQKAASEQMTTEEKFCDFGYQFVYYTLSCANFTYHLWGTSWFWELSKCYDSYPNDTMPLGIRVGMWSCMGFYLNQLLLLLQQPRRSDFYTMLTHHIMTLTIFSMSYFAKMARIVVVTALLHEVVDIFMSFGKLFHYCGYQRAMDFCFMCFCVVWYATRPVVYPYYLIGTSIMTPEALIPSEYVAITCTIILYFAHLVWTVELTQHIVMRFRTPINQFSDERSGVEDNELSEKED